MTDRFKNKPALVTCAGTGFGRAIAKRLAEEAGTVVVTGRTEGTLAESVGQHSKLYLSPERTTY